MSNPNPLQPGRTLPFNDQSLEYSTPGPPAHLLQALRARFPSSSAFEERPPQNRARAHVVNDYNWNMLLNAAHHLGLTLHYEFSHMLHYHTAVYTGNGSGFNYVPYFWIWPRGGLIMQYMWVKCILNSPHIWPKRPTGRWPLWYITALAAPCRFSQWTASSQPMRPTKVTGILSTSSSVSCAGSYKNGGGSHVQYEP